MKLFSSKPTETPAIAAPSVSVFDNPLDERCQNPRCSRYITREFTPEAVVVGPVPECAGYP